MKKKTKEEDLILEIETKQSDEGGLEMFYLLDNVIKYYSYKNGVEENIDDSENWKKLLNNNVAIPEKIDKQIEKVFSVQLNNILKKERKNV